MAEDVSLKKPSPMKYLGDGVYAWFDGYQIWICISDGIEELQGIALEPSTFSALETYAQQFYGKKV